jgi:hypothetical protein
MRSYDMVNQNEIEDRTTNSVCALCECEAFDMGYVEGRLLDWYCPRESSRDYHGLKQELEQEFGLDLTISVIKHHVKEHTAYFPEEMANE